MDIVYYPAIKTDHGYFKEKEKILHPLFLYYKRLKKIKG